MGKASTIAISHFGICCADVELSKRFYTEGLGFSVKQSIDELGEPFDKLVELPGTKMRIHQVQCGDTMLELIGYVDTPTTGSAERRPMNQVGITHMTLIAEDVEATAGRIAEFGGSVVDKSRTDSAYGPLLFCTDPDGVRIELMQLPEA